jgi:hypothetical protein
VEYDKLEPRFKIVIQVEEMQREKTKKKELIEATIEVGAGIFASPKTCRGIK